MSTDIAGTSLAEPEQIDWDNYNPGSKFTPPPPALGVDGKALVYYGTLPTTVKAEVDEKSNMRTYLLDPIKLVRSGSADGYEIRFTRVGLKQFTNKKTGKPINASMAGNLLRSVGITAKPQRTAEYDAAMNLTKGKVASFTIDWQARNKDTGEAIYGYENFPDDPIRPGQKKAVLKAGDTYRDKDGATQVVKADVLFANAKVRFFVDPNRK